MSEDITTNNKTGVGVKYWDLFNLILCSITFGNKICSQALSVSE